MSYANDNHSSRSFAFMITRRTALSILTGLFLLSASLSFGQTAPTMSKPQEQNEQYLAAPLLQLEDYYSHHVIVVEKSTHQLFLFENVNSTPRLVKTYQAVTGKKQGNKTNAGDLKTPEGIYYFNDFRSHKELVRTMGKEGEIYGVGAFVTNYPNPFDHQEKKGGGGIWLHSTNDESRINKGLDSKGCVVLANNDLKEVAQYIELDKMPFIIVQDLHFMNKETWETNRDGINQTLNSWADAWRKKDFNRYLSYYDAQDFRDPVRGKFPSFKRYKQAVFSNPGYPEINLIDVNILNGGSYALVTFTQKYKSKTINDTGKKLLYMRKNDGYEWKIVAEIWAKLPTGEHKKFIPSQRFFKE